MARTEVSITVDVEHSIAGAFGSPDRFQPLGEEVVRCTVNGKDQGLGFILDTLGQHGLTGTFFVEALQTVYFGDEPMGEVARRIAAQGHDAQLHLHPCWMSFAESRWKMPGFIPNDACAGRSAADLDRLIGMGLDVFARWGVPCPLAIRTGGFSTDRAVYQAMQRAGILLASNISIGVQSPSDPDLALSGGRRLIDGVLEVPALSYLSRNLRRLGSDNWRTLAITATGSWEMERLLWAARAAGIRSVVILTHPFEFIKQTGFRFNNLHVNRINQRRFRALAAFLGRNRADFDTVTFGQKAQDWARTGNVDDARLRSSLGPVALRMAENALNDVLPFI